MAMIDKIQVGSTTYDVGGGTYTTTTLTAFSAAGSKRVTENLSGVTSSSTPILDVVTSTTAATAETQIEDWSKIYAAVTDNGGITFYANDATSQSLTISVKGY